jgi:hypothetical protein
MDAMPVYVTRQNPVAGEEPLTPTEITSASTAVARAILEAGMLEQFLRLVRRWVMPAPRRTLSAHESNVLRHFGLPRLANPADLARRRGQLARVFRIVLGRRSAPSQLDAVARKYHDAALILAGNDLAIAHTPRDSGFADHAASSFPITGYRYGVSLGPIFFEDRSDNPRQQQLIQTCRTAPGEWVLFRASELIHEAVHWVNEDEGRGREGHARHGSLHDPYHYSYFVIEMCCGRSTVGEYRGYHERQLATRSTDTVHNPGSHAGFRVPRPTGFA